MFSRAKRFVRSRLANLFEDTVNQSMRRDAKAAPETKVAQKALFHYYSDLLSGGRRIPALDETGFRVFSQFDEDGRLLFIFAVLGVHTGVFVDIGAADGVNSNCANLAVNFGWDGVFLDADLANIERGRKFYATHPDTWAYPPRFVHATVTRENVNALLEAAGVAGDVDFLSIDIDGNDYWIWDAIHCITPKVVMIETHVEFGLRSIVVPYDADYVPPGKHPHYHGASPPAMAKLADRKGYRLVGANQYGFNTIYVRRGLGEAALPEVSVESVLEHPRNRERQRLFEAIKDFDYIEV